MRSLLLLILLSWTVPAYSAEEEKSTTPSDTSVVVEEKEGTAGWRALLFPFAIPPMLVRTLAYPLKAFADWAEKIDLPNRTIDFFSNDERTAFWYPTFRMGGSGGFLMGLGASHRNLFHQHYRLSARAQISPEFDQDISLSFSTPPKTDGNLSTGLYASRLRRQEEDFFGLGNNTLDTPLPYELDLLTFGIPFGGQVGELTWQLFAQGVNFASQNHDFPANDLNGTFPATQTPGLERRIWAAEGGVRLNLDTRDLKGTPGSGTAAFLSFSRFEGEDSFAFFKTQFFLAQYFTLFVPGRVLALGGRLELVNPIGGDVIPFPLLPTLGGSRYLRGFESGRFRDQASLVLISEYRYPVWQWLDGMLFVEGGRVGTGIDDLHPNGFHLSYGGGFRFRMPNQFFFEAQGAASSSGPRFVFTFNQPI